jgi:hypothetical protein
MKIRLALACLAFAIVPAAAQVVYNDGPINGNVDAWEINFSYITADSFTVSTSSATLTGLSFGAWLAPGDVLQMAEVWITSEALGGTTYFDQVVSFNQSGCVANQYGYNVCTEFGSFNGPTLQNGTYWLNLENAVVPSGDPVFWDENSGVGCSSPGCPSQATCNSCVVNGKASPQDLPPEAFTLYGTSAATVPEPGSLLLFTSGFLSSAWVARRRRSRRVK